MAGYVFCVILLVICAVLLAAAFVFGARGTVDVFGFNIYIAQTDEFEAVAEGSAVFVKRCEPYDLNDGNLILYYSDEFSPALGYVDDVHMEDGSYIISASNSRGNIDIQADAFVGRADTSSAFLGAIIRFARQPAGVLVMAVLPCIALVVYDILRARAAAQPIPEVEPVYKNVDEDKPTSAKGISVKPDGNAQYSRKTDGSANNSAADKVLFSYAGKQRTAPKKPEIIPLTDATAQKKAPEKAVSRPAVSAANTAAKTPPKTAEKPHELPLYPKRESEESAGGAVSAKTPAPVAARRYLDSAAQSVSSATAELPELPKKQKKDAFFTQSDAPQIGRQKSAARSVIELEDALSSACPASAREYTGKKSAAMIASRSAALFTEDDDSRDRERYEVDDILAGLDKRKNL